MSDLIDRDAAMKLRDTLADIIGAAPMSSIHSALSEYRKAIRALPAVEVGVKPLEWFEVEKSRNGGKYTADGYTIRYIEGLWLLDFAGDSKAVWRFPTLEAAKAAAQADCAARIRSALTIAPDPRCAECDCANGGSDCTWIKTPAQEITVWYGSMPESNGKSNWTASLQRKSGDTHLDGFCFARSEYPDRVRYEADRVRWIIGELAEKPDILAYDPGLHSGYIYPPAPDAGKVQALVEQSKSLLNAYDAWARCVSGTPEDHIAGASLFSRTIRLRAALAAMKEG